MIGGTPVSLESNYRIGISPWRSGWATFVHMESSNRAPTLMNSLAVLDMQVTAGTDSGTLDA